MQCAHGECIEIDFSGGHWNAVEPNQRTALSLSNSHRATAGLERKCIYSGNIAQHLRQILSIWSREMK
jgi:hypothetical protein